MSFGVALTLIMIGASAVQVLVVASFAIARSRLDLKWMAANCITGAGFSLACFFSASDKLPFTLQWSCGPLGYCMSALYFSTIIHFLNANIARTPRPFERWVHYGLGAVAVIVWIPGLMFQQELRGWTYLGTSYVFPMATSLLPYCGVALFAGIFTLVCVLRNCPKTYQFAGAFFALCAVNDVCVSLGIWEVTWVASLGTLVFLSVVSQHEAKKWAAEANLLTELKTTLETRVAERSAELAASQDELSKHERLAALGRLAASVGHEINNPLTYVICNLDLIKIRSDDSHALIDDALEGAKRIGRIVSELRILSRPIGDSEQVIDVSEIVETAAKTLGHLETPTKRFDLNCVPGCYVRGSRDRLTQLMVNLLSNAIAALPDDDQPRSVDATVYTTDEKVVTIIQDEGCGIPVAIQERLFEPFMTTKTEGLGLGLAMCRIIVDEMQGKMHFVSEVGSGTKFEISFDRCVCPQVQRQSTEKVIASALAEPVRKSILIIDDEPGVLITFKRMLHRCDVTTTSNVTEAISLLCERDFDVVFCDVVMPVLTGPELVQKAQQLKPNGLEKFVLMSGGTPNTKTVQDVSEIPFLQKPFTPADVYRFLRDDLVSFETTDPDNFNAQLPY